MNRRDVLMALLAAGMATTPLEVRPQAPRRVGVIHSLGGSFNPDKWGGIALVKAIKDLGYKEGQDVVFDFRVWQKSEEIPGLVHDLLRLKVDVIVAASPPTISAAKSATATVPIVFVFSAEPVATGLVRSLNRPGGNITGLAWDHGFETYAKQLELFKDALPRLRRVAVLWDANSDSTHDIYVRFYTEAAPRLGLEIVSVGTRSAADFESAFETIRRNKAEALIVLPSAQVTVPHRDAIMNHATKNRLPTLAGIIQFAYPGALFQSAPNHSDYPGRVAVYVDKILKGTKPGDLPVEQPSKYDLVVDLKTARGLGISLPQSILVRADKVIE